MLTAEAIFSECALNGKFGFTEWTLTFGSPNNRLTPPATPEQYTPNCRTTTGATWPQVSVAARGPV